VKRAELILGVVLLSAAPETAAPQGHRGRMNNEPSRLVMQYVKLDNEGASLTDEGWRSIAALFTNPGPRPTGELFVYEERGVFDSLVTPGSDRAEVGVQGRANGEYHPRTGRYHTEKIAGPSYMKDSMEVVRVGGRWKIKGPVPRPSITWQTAMRLATELRDTTTDPKVKRNATLSVNAFLRYH
jgi:hypothetical protein